MCGFAGFFGGDIADRRGTAEKMGERIAHRGPDDSGIFDDGRAALSFRRLSIIDLDRGVQPMRSEDDTERYTISKSFARSLRGRAFPSPPRRIQRSF